MLVGKRLLAYLARVWRGARSSAAGLSFPLSGSWLGGRRVRDPTRFAEGLALVLPGVEGRGALNLDVFVLGAGTLLLGTVDGRHAVSAGCIGFSLPTAANREVRELYRLRLRQCRYSPAKVRQFHLGGHFGCANRVFVAETVAPLLLEAAALRS
jgi:hypothetical protein